MLLLLLTFLLHFPPPVPALSGDAGTAVMWSELKLCTDPKEEFLQLMAGWWRWIPGRGEREQKFFWHVQSKGKMLKPHNLIRASKCLIFPQMCPFSLPLESHLGWCQEAQWQLCESLATQGGRAVLQSEPRAQQGQLCMDWQGTWRRSNGLTGNMKEKHSASAAAPAPRQQQGAMRGKGSWTEGWGRRVGTVDTGRASVRSGGSDSCPRCWCGCVGGVFSSLSSTKTLNSYL